MPQPSPDILSEGEIGTKKGLINERMGHGPAGGTIGRVKCQFHRGNSSLCWKWSRRMKSEEIEAPVTLVRSGSGNHK